MLYSLVAFLGLLASADALLIGAPATRHTLVSASMKLERKPGEGDPFDGGNIRLPEEGARVDLDSARYHADAGYIDEDDEPW